MYGKKSITNETDKEWNITSPESQGMISDMLIDMIEHIKENQYNTHSILIHRNGHFVFEAYFHPYDKSTSHNLKSTSKGVISALVGIAIREGFIDNLEQKVYNFFPEYTDDNTNESKLEIKIKHLLTMTAGLKWTENDIKSMLTFISGQRIKNILRLPLIETPGTTFNYNTGLTHLLSGIITKSSGMSTLEFANKYLFENLNIHNVQWSKDYEGYYIGGSELFLTPRAMLKFGLLYLNNGRWNEKQIIPEEWVEKSISTGTEGNFHGINIDYGYLWWLDINSPIFYFNSENDINKKDFLAMGVHGQRIYVNRNLNLVVVITADEHDESRCDKLIKDFIIPSVMSEQSIKENESVNRKLKMLLEEIIEE